MTRPTSDVVIVGAGLAGVTAAIVLARLGVTVTLIDQRAVQPPVFRAEKLEPDQVAILRDFGLMESIAPVSRRIRRVAKAYRGRVLQVLETEEYGFFYQDLVNALRRQIPATVTMRVGRVSAVHHDERSSRAILADGSSVDGSLLILATGTTGKLHEDLGLTRTMLSAGHSICVGFTLAPPVRFRKSVDSLTYYMNGSHRIGYLSLFPVPNGMRVNMFAYWAPGDLILEELREGGVEFLLGLMPGLAGVAGPLELMSKIEARPIDLYSVTGTHPARILLIGDAFQSVCPSTGTGLSKVLVDVQTLQRYVPAWLETASIGPDETGQFYADEKKRAADAFSLQGAEYQRWLGTSVSIRSRIHRAMEIFRMATNRG